jgi:hypothetical protein
MPRKFFRFVNDNALQVRMGAFFINPFSGDCFAGFWFEITLTL